MSTHRSTTRRAIAALTALALSAGLLATTAVAVVATATPAAADSPAACGVAGVRDTSPPPAPGLVLCLYLNRGVDGVGGQADTFTVPTNTHLLHLSLNGGYSSGLAEADLDVVPGQVLQINVGGKGDPNADSLDHNHFAQGGWNGGGPGGTDGFSCTINTCGAGGDGAVDVRTGGFGLADRVLVAGGKGGSGGRGGGLVGSNGGTETCTNCSFDYTGGGTGGNQSGGGPAGGTAQAGGFGGGGAGGDGVLNVGQPAIGGDGGGGGWYGGGGGSGRVYGFCCLIYLKGGGGGGSGHAGPGTHNANLVTDGGVGNLKAVTIRSIPDPFTTTTTVQSSRNPSLQGELVTYTATVRTSDPSFPLGGGSVQLLNNYTGTAFAALTPLTLTPGDPSSGTIQITSGAVPPGVYQIRADYLGYSTPDGFTDLPSGSGLSLLQTVNPKATQAITFTTPAPSDAAVGDTYHVAATGGASGNPVTFTTSLNNVCSVSGGTVTMGQTGQCNVFANQAGDASYTAAPTATQTFGVRLPDQTVTFTSTAPTGALVGGTYVASATHSGGGGAVTFDTTPHSVCTASGATVTFLTAGTCTVRASAASSGSDRGGIAFQSFVIAQPQDPNQPAITLQPADISTTTGTPVTFTVAATSALPGMTVQWQARTATGGMVDIPGATATSVTVTPALSDDLSGYRALFSNTAGTVITNTGVLRVTKPVLRINATPKTKAYNNGQSDPVLTVTMTGFTGGDTPASISGFTNCSRTPGESVAGGPYTIHCSEQTFSSPKYDIVAGDTAPFTITPYPVVVNADNAFKYYGAPEPTTYPFYYSLIGNDAATTTVTGAPYCTRAPGETVAGGPYMISCAPGTLTSSSANYVFAAGPSFPRFTIAKATLLVDAVPASKVVGDADPPLKFTYSGFKLGETAATATISPPGGFCTRTAGETVAASPYTISCSPGGGTSAANYLFEHGSTAPFTITRPVLSVNADLKTKTYGSGSDPTLTVTLTGFRPGDTEASSGITGSPSCTRAAGETVADAPLLITCTPGSLSAPGYSFATGFQGVLVIAPAPLSVNAVATSKVYGSGDPALSSELTGFRLSETASTAGVTGSASCTRAAGESVGAGPYAITCTGGTLSAPNYTFVQGTGAGLTVTKAVLSVDAVAAEKAPGADDPELTATYSGFVRGDTDSVVSGAPSCGRDSGEAIGTYGITCSAGTLAAADYSFRTGAPATFTITTAVLTSIDVAPAFAELPVGATQQYTATGTYGDGTTRDLTSSVVWSEQEDFGTPVATITSSGFVTVVGEGFASIRAGSGDILGATVLTGLAAGQRAATTMVNGTNSSARAGATVALVGTLTRGTTPVSGRTVVFTLGSQGCSTVTGSNGRASCSVVLNQARDTTTSVATFAGDDGLLGSSASKAFTIKRDATKVVYSGVKAGRIGDTVSLGATLTGTLNGTTHPIVGRTLTFTLGTLICAATTGVNGAAGCTVQLVPPATKSSTVNVRFDGDGTYQPTAAAKPFSVTPLPSALTFTVAKTVRPGSTVALPAKLTSGSTPIVGATVAFTLGTQSCTAVTGADGTATCSVVLTQPVGAIKASATFAGDPSHVAVKTNKDVTIK